VLLVTFCTCSKYRRQGRVKWSDGPNIGRPWLQFGRYLSALFPLRIRTMWQFVALILTAWCLQTRPPESNRTVVRRGHGQNNKIRIGLRANFCHKKYEFICFFLYLDTGCLWLLGTSVLLDRKPESAWVSPCQLPGWKTRFYVAPCTRQSACQTNTFTATCTGTVFKSTSSCVIYVLWRCRTVTADFWRVVPCCFVTCCRRSIFSRILLMLFFNLSLSIPLCI
jgi:hypothetical protein